MITQPAYEKYFTKQSLHSLHGYLRITAANGLEIPYLGYFEADVEVKGRVIKDRGIVVKKDGPEAGGLEVDMVLGTNVLRELHGWPAVPEVKVRGFAKVAGRSPAHVPARSVACIRAFGVGGQVKKDEGGVLIEPLAEGGPKGLMVASTVSQVEGGNFWVQVVNVSEEAVTIPPGTRLGTLHSHDGEVTVACNRVSVEVTCNHIQVTSKPDTDHSKPSPFNLSGANGSLREVQRLQQLLEKNKDMFYFEDHDLGHTEVDKHRLRLKDDIPVASTFHRIPPSQYDETYPNASG
jgi:hypothetical protein